MVAGPARRCLAGRATPVAASAGGADTQAAISSPQPRLYSLAAVGHTTSVRSGLRPAGRFCTGRCRCVVHGAAGVAVVVIHAAARHAAAAGVAGYCADARRGRCIGRQPAVFGRLVRRAEGVWGACAHASHRAGLRAHLDRHRVRRQMFADGFARMVRTGCRTTRGLHIDGIAVAACRLDGDAGVAAAQGLGRRLLGRWRVTPCNLQSRNGFTQIPIHLQCLRCCNAALAG